MSKHQERLIEALISPFDGPSPVRTKALIQHFGNFLDLMNAGQAELVAAGLSKTAALHLVRSRRVAGALIRGRPARRVIDARGAVRLVPHLTWHRVEELWVIALDSTRRALACTLVARGSASGCPVSPGEVLGVALRLRARSVVVLHNHPSGDPTPSFADRDFTTRLRTAASLLDVEIADHVVVAGLRFASIITRRSGTLVAPSFRPSWRRASTRTRGRALPRTAATDVHVEAQR